MTYGVTVDVEAPVEMYDALHAEVMASTHARVEGLLLHVGRATATGFQVTEVWTDKAQYDRFNEQVVWPAAARLAAAHPTPEPQARTDEFEVRGLVLPGEHVVQ